jgi:hypothetical protein
MKHIFTSLVAALLLTLVFAAEGVKANTLAVPPGATMNLSALSCDPTASECNVYTGAEIGGTLNVASGDILMIGPQGAQIPGGLNIYSGGTVCVTGSIQGNIRFVTGGVLYLGTMSNSINFTGVGPYVNAPSAWASPPCQTFGQ